MPRHRSTVLIRLILFCSTFLFPPYAVAAPPAQAAYRFEIPAGTLGDALSLLERVAGVIISAPEQADLSQLRSSGLSQTCTVQQALEALLAGTGLTFRPSGPNTFSLQIAPVSERVEVRAKLPYPAEMTSTATRTLTPLRDVPQAVTVITQPMMADQQMTGMADVLRYVPGIGMAQGEGNRDTPILRGNTTTADFFVDGLRDDVQYYRDLYNVERVEALKGPNAMIFGRGGAGGVINRTTRQADWGTATELTVQGGSYGHRRATFDLDRPVNGTLAARVAGLYENSGSYRQDVALERYAINPTLALSLPGSTTLRAGYERFHDERTADRGGPSFGDHPYPAEASTFFGDPDLSTASVTVDALTVGVDRAMGRGTLLRSRARLADYDKFYQNVYPASAVSVDGTSLGLGAYNNATARRNLFSQTDVTLTATTGQVRHVLLTGMELGRQVTDNFRQTGYFGEPGSSVTTMRVAVTSPTVSVPVAFRQNATDADNHGVATVVAFYAQDQAQVTRRLQAVGGLRYDRFAIAFRNHRTQADTSNTDHLVSPRFGLVYNAAPALSLYSSYTLTHVPRAGDQLSSLTISNRSLDPEKFTNYELGAKWDIRGDLSATAAIYRLNRTNVVVPDPVDVTRSLLVDGQRTIGVEIGLAGNITDAWRVLGAYAYQDGKITRTLAANAPAGAVLAQVPVHSMSLWNRYDFTQRWGIGLGIVYNGDRFTSTDNTVVLPAFTRLDAAVFATLTRQLRAQVNVENLLDERYYASANGNNNIAPGAPRSVRVSLTTRF